MTPGFPAKAVPRDLDGGDLIFTPPKKRALLLLLALLTGILLPSCGSAQPSKDQYDLENAIFSTIVRRLDAQSQLYSELAQMVRDLPDAPDQDRAISELKHYIDGALVFIQDSYINGNLTIIFDDQEETRSLLYDLFTNWLFKAEKLKELTPEELIQLSDLLETLEQCCYRGSPDTSFAYYISQRDTESDEFSDAMGTAQDTFDQLKEFESRHKLEW